MTIPLWLPWAVVAALALPALFAPRYAERGFAGHARTWSAAVVALVVATALTIDHYRVSEEELFDATEHAAAVLDGSLGDVTLDRLTVEIEDVLGRGVAVEELEGGAEANPQFEQTSFYEVRVAGQGSGGPPACVEVNVSDYGQAGIGWVTLSASHGRCG